LNDVEGRNILIFRGRGGRELLKQALEARGAHVSYVECYRRTRPAQDPAELLRAWRAGEVHAVSALSAETLENFVEMVGAQGRALLRSTALVVPHEAVAGHALAREFARVVVAPPGRGAMARALASLRVTT
jgi:uroporphyrinogen-III synthase